MKKIQTGDKVIVVAGKRKGARSSVVTVKGDKIYLDWVNVVKKAVKGEGFKEKEAPIHASNIAHYDEKSSSASKVGVRVTSKGKKERFYKKSGSAVK